MKRILFLFLSVVAINAVAQNIDYNKIILPDYVKDVDFGEKLVQIAWRNNPKSDIAKRNITIAQLDKKRYSVDWLNFINLQSNLNPYTVDRAVNGSNDTNGKGFYPIWNVRMSLNLGAFFTIPYDNKKAKQMVGIAQDDLNNQKLELRNQVLKAYNDYLLMEKSYKIQTQMLSDTESSFKLVEQKFKNGETNFESYVSSLNNYNRLSINILEAENNYKNAKLDLEQLIGIKLEDVR
jgi:outer membrane protein TolC